MKSIAKVPSSAGSLKRNEGCKDAPNCILQELKTIYSCEKGIQKDYSVSEILVNGDNVLECFSNLKNSSADIYLGGDHSITYACFQSLKNSDAGLIILDAHPDVDECTDIPTHEDYLRKLIDEGLVKGENVILVGIRNYGANEMEFIKKNKIKNYSARSIFENGIQEVADSITEIASSFSEVYLSIDIDVADSVFVPGTGMPEPAGLSSREVIYLVQRIRLLRNLTKADIVEVNPSLDLNNCTSRFAARILEELL